MSLTAVVPARGGSRGIPGKALRSVAGTPLLLRTLQCLDAVPGLERIVVSTDNGEIAAVARLNGYTVLDRPASLATDKATLAEVARHAQEELDAPVGIFQPTAPLLTPETVSLALGEYEHGGPWTVLQSAVPVTGFYWHDNRPLFSERVNRQQQAPQVLKEVGCFALWKPGLAGVDNPTVRLFSVPVAESLDVDSFADLRAAELALGRKRIRFVIAAGHEVGSGHVFRAMRLAEELSHHHIEFAFVGTPPDWARAAVTGRGWEVVG